MNNKSKFKTGDVVISLSDVFDFENPIGRGEAPNLGRETFTVTEIYPAPNCPGFVVVGDRSDKRSCQVWAHEDDLTIA